MHNRIIDGLFRPQAAEAEAFRRAEAAWRVLEQVLSLVRHAELKAVATLAAAGVLGQILIVLSRDPASVAATVCSLTATGFAVAAGICSMWVLWPRTTFRGPAPNLLYFGAVANTPGLTMEVYQRQLAELAGDPEELLAQVAAQVWMNSRIARRKFWLANFAVLGVLAATIAVGCAFVASV